MLSLPNALGSKFLKFSKSSQRGGSGVDTGTLLSSVSKDCVKRFQTDNFSNNLKILRTESDADSV